MFTLMGTELKANSTDGSNSLACPFLRGISCMRSPEANQSISSFKVVNSDIDGLSVKVKKMTTVALAEANALALKSQQEEGDEAERLFRR